jgi:hypothetical protein
MRILVDGDTDEFLGATILGLHADDLIQIVSTAMQAGVKAVPATLRSLMRHFWLDRIVHLAAQPGVHHSLVDPYLYVQTNVMGHLVVLELARRSRASLVLTLGALLAEVAHTRPIKLSGSSYDPELSARLGLRPTRYEGPTGIVGVLNVLCRDAGVPTASLWANVPHYVSGIENPRAALALVRRVLTLLNTEADLTDLREAAEQFDQNLGSIVAQNAKIQEYVSKLERKNPDEDDEPVAPEEPEASEVADAREGKDELPPSADLVAEIESLVAKEPLRERLRGFIAGDAPARSKPSSSASCCRNTGPCPHGPVLKTVWPR